MGGVCATDDVFETQSNMRRKRNESYKDSNYDLLPYNRGILSTTIKQHLSNIRINLFGTKTSIDCLCDDLLAYYLSEFLSFDDLISYHLLNKESIN